MLLMACRTKTQCGPLLLLLIHLKWFRDAFQLTTVVQRDYLLSQWCDEAWQANETAHCYCTVHPALLQRRECWTPLELPPGSSLLFFSMHVSTGSSPMTLTGRRAFIRELLRSAPSEAPFWHDKSLYPVYRSIIQASTYFHLATDNEKQQCFNLTG